VSNLRGADAPPHLVVRLALGERGGDRGDAAHKLGERAIKAAEAAGGRAPALLLVRAVREHERLEDGEAALARHVVRVPQEVRRQRPQVLGHVDGQDVGPLKAHDHLPQPISIRRLGALRPVEPPVLPRHRHAPQVEPADAHAIAIEIARARVRWPPRCPGRRDDGAPVDCRGIVKAGALKLHGGREGLDRRGMQGE
jgi:hypothetical protein